MIRIAQCTTWCAACGGYLLFAGVLSRHELITAGVLASGAWIWAFAIRRGAQERFRMSPAHAVEWASATVALGPALARTLAVFARAALLGRSPGHLLEVPFERGAEDDPADAARRASALLIASFGPDTIAVRAPLRQDRVLLHGILPADGPRDPRWLNP